MGLHHIQDIHDLAPFFNIYHIIAFADDNFCINVKRCHNGLDLAGFRLCRADDLKMVKLLRITDGSGCKKSAAQKCPAAAGVLNDHISHNGKILSDLSVLRKKFCGFQYAECIFMLFHTDRIDPVFSQMRVPPYRNISFYIKCFSQ